MFKYASFAVCCNLIGLAFGRLPAPFPIPFPIQPMRQLIYAETSRNAAAEKGWRVLTSAAVARATFLSSCFINYYSN